MHKIGILRLQYPIPNLHTTLKERNPVINALNRIGSVSDVLRFNTSMEGAVGKRSLVFDYTAQRLVSISEYDRRKTRDPTYEKPSNQRETVQMTGQYK